MLSSDLVMIKSKIWFPLCVGYFTCWVWSKVCNSSINLTALALVCDHLCEVRDTSLCHCNWALIVSTSQLTTFFSAVGARFFIFLIIDKAAKYEDTVFIMWSVHFKFSCTHILRNLKNCTLSRTSPLTLILSVWLSNLCCLDLWSVVIHTRIHTYFIWYSRLN